MAVLVGYDFGVRSSGAGCGVSEGAVACDVEWGDAVNISGGNDDRARCGAGGEGKVGRFEVFAFGYQTALVVTDFGLGPWCDQVVDEDLTCAGDV